MSYIAVLVRKLVPPILVATLLLGIPTFSAAEASSASLVLIVSDTSGAVIPGAIARLRNSDTNQAQTSVSSKTGSASFVFLKPGHYALTVSKDGFSDVTVTGILLDVGDEKHIQLVLKVGGASQNVTVDGSGPTINTTDGSVSTVIGRQFVATIPLNGRSFQDLISLTPGVVTGSPQTQFTSPGSTGDFSVNGQRTDQNYYTIDGISANVTPAASSYGGAGASGVTPATTAFGTTQSLLSVDDLQEFRVASSSYSAEFGRAPGGQLTFITRSGTNSFHGSTYDYLRNGWFDANDWFNDTLGQPKVVLHQNDFGGTLGGPVWIPGLYKGKDSTFFFLSYEGLRLIEPVAATTEYVPDMYMREQAPAALAPMLNAYPLPTKNGTDYGTAQSPSLAQFFQGFSVPGTIDSTSVRLDHTFTPFLSAFFRFSDTPSLVESRDQALLTTNQINVQTYTLGTTYNLSRSSTNEFRLGFSKSFSGNSTALDSFGGAVPTDVGREMGSLNGVTGKTLTAEFSVQIIGVGTAFLLPSASQYGRQRQWNLTDMLNVTHRSQQWKLGIDFRPISTVLTPEPFVVLADYRSFASVLSNTARLAEYGIYQRSTPQLKQVALFAQDDWQINSRLSLSGGLRWELSPPPSNATNPQPYTVAGDLSNPSSLSLAPAGTRLWHTQWLSFAPRLGLSWQAHSTTNWATVLRAGGGVFFDASNEEALPAFGSFGNSVLARYTNISLPLTQAQQSISISIAPPYTNIYAFPAHLQLPYALQWNATVEQQLGQHNTADLSYIGSNGRRQNAEQELSLSALNPSFGTLFHVFGVTSDYNALQAKLQRSVAKGTNALVAYTWSHSIDYGSSVAPLPVTRGNSDFDVRQVFQGGITSEIPHLASARAMSAILNGWGVDGRVIARTGYPITLEGNLDSDPATGGLYYTNVDLTAGQPIYVYGNQYPGGRSLNPNAFTYPNGNDPGDAPRNFVRGFGEWQVNFAARREFPFSEKVHLQVRGEAFNILNHPNFGYIDSTLGDATFGKATQMLDNSLGTVAAQYQQGGPRSMQFELRIAF